MGAKSVPCWPTETWEHSWETSGKRQVWTCGREKRRGGSRLESPFPTVPLPPACDGAVVAQPSPETICTWCNETLLLLGSLGDAWVSCFSFSFLFFHLDPFTFQHPETENTISARNHHLGKSLYSRSSQFKLTLVSEIVLLLLQVTPKIVT